MADPEPTPGDEPVGLPHCRCPKASHFDNVEVVSCVLRWEFIDDEANSLEWVEILGEYGVGWCTTFTGPPRYSLYRTKERAQKAARQGSMCPAGRRCTGDHMVIHVDQELADPRIRS